MLLLIYRFSQSILAVKYASIGYYFREGREQISRSLLFSLGMCSVVSDAILPLLRYVLILEKLRSIRNFTFE